MTARDVTAPGADGDGNTCPGTDPSDSCTVSGLTNGDSYTFTVTATNSDGTGDASVPSDEVTPAPQVPDAPTGVSASAGDHSATVSWTAAGDEGSTVTGYTVTAQDLTAPGTDGDGTTCPGTDPGDSCTITGLTNGDAYTFSVTATNGEGTGAAGTSDTVTPSTVPDAPTGVAATAGNAVRHGDLDGGRRRGLGHHRLHGDGVELQPAPHLHDDGHHLHLQRPVERGELLLHRHGHQRRRQGCPLGALEHGPADLEHGHDQHAGQLHARLRQDPQVHGEVPRQPGRHHLVAQPARLAATRPRRQGHGPAGW